MRGQNYKSGQFAQDDEYTDKNATKHAEKGELNVIYSTINPPEYVETELSKNVAIRTIIVIIVAILAFLIPMNEFLPDKELLDSYYEIYTDESGYISPEDKQYVENRYNKNWTEAWNSGFGVCFALSVTIGLITLGICCFIFPNEKKIKNIEIFKQCHNFPDDIYCIHLEKGVPNIPNVEMATWVKNDELHISSNLYKNDFGEIIIPLKNIVFFVRDGDFYTKTKLNRNGRVIGGLIAGPTGFLTGTNTSAETIEVDNRKTILYLECEGEEETWIFDSSAYNSFMFLFPQLEYKKVVSKPQNLETNNKPNSSDNLEQIKKLKELLDIGAISQEEYDIKKQELLNKI